MVAPGPADLQPRPSPYWPPPPWLIAVLVVTACLGAALLGRLIAAHRSPAAEVAPRDALPAGLASPFADRRAQAVVFSAEATPPETDTPLLPSSVEAVYAFFSLPERVNPDELTLMWWWNGGEMAAPPVEVLDTDQGPALARVTLAPGEGAGPLGPGVGEFEARRGDLRIARGSFVTADEAVDILAQPEPPVVETAIRGIVTARRVGEDGDPEDTSEEFGGDARIWVVFEYEGADPGAVFAVRWYCEGQELTAARREIPIEAARGRGHGWISAGPGEELPPARYEATVSYGPEGVVLGRHSFSVVP